MESYAELLSQLEESKFLRLFRYLIDGNKTYYDELDPAAEALTASSAELHLKRHIRIGSMNSSAAYWLFQIGHLPAFLQHPDFIEPFLHQRLAAGFAALKQDAKVWNILHGDAPDTAFPDEAPPPEPGYTYYFLTNICYDISQQALKAYSETAHELFAKVLHVSSEAQPRFGLGTPETVARSRSDVERFLVGLMGMPSSYYLIAREGRISVVPVTERGMYLAGERKGTQHAAERASIITSSVRCAVAPVTAKSITAFEALLNDVEAGEADFQDFFEKNPAYLFALDEKYCEIRPHVCLFDPARERLVPDFMVRIEDSQAWDVIELKRPQHPIVARTKTLQRLAAQAAAGVAGLLRYRDFFSTRANRKVTAKRLAIAPYEPCLVLVIGRGRPTERYEWRSVRVGFPSVQIVSYDYVFERARRCVEHLKSHPPTIHTD